MKRRRFLKTASLGTISAGFAPYLPSISYSQQTRFPDVVVVDNGEPDALISTACKEIGGLQRFISKGDIVVIKPNIGWDRVPELAANTNPHLVGKLTELCFEAGAKQVKIFDRTCNNPLRCYSNSLIEENGSRAGADVLQIRQSRYISHALPNGKLLREWPIYQDYLEADKVINVPIAKHHSMSSVTLGLKNLMGVMGGDRGSLHSDFAVKLIDIVETIKPTLTVIDAYRVLLHNGPQGGNPDDVRLARTLILSPCTVCADIASLELFDLRPAQVEHLQEAINRKMAIINHETLNLKKVTLS